MVKKLPVMQETRVPSLGKDTLEKRMTTYSSILALRIPWTKEPVCVCVCVYIYIHIYIPHIYVCLSHLSAVLA